jgi:uncharacterized coiled-coil protein SlyX
MPDFNTLFNSYGVTIALVLWFLYNEAWPFVRDKIFSRWAKRRDDVILERQKRLTEHNTQVNEYRAFLLEELKSTRNDAKEDREETRQVLRELKSVIENVTTQMRALTDRVITLDTDVREVYKVLGKDKSLIN